MKKYLISLETEKKYVTTVRLFFLSLDYQKDLRVPPGPGRCGDAGWACPVRGDRPGRRARSRAEGARRAGSQCSSTSSSSPPHRKTFLKIFQKCLGSGASPSSGTGLSEGNATSATKTKHWNSTRSTPTRAASLHRNRGRGNGEPHAGTPRRQTSGAAFPTAATDRKAPQRSRPRPAAGLGTRMPQDGKPPGRELWGLPAGEQGPRGAWPRVTVGGRPASRGHLPRRAWRGGAGSCPGPGARSAGVPRDSAAGAQAAGARRPSGVTEPRAGRDENGRELSNGTNCSACRRRSREGAGDRQMERAVDILDPERKLGPAGLRQAERGDPRGTRTSRARVSRGHGHESASPSACHIQQREIGGRVRARAAAGPGLRETPLSTRKRQAGQPPMKNTAKPQRRARCPGPGGAVGWRRPTPQRPPPAPLRAGRRPRWACAGRRRTRLSLSCLAPQKKGSSRVDPGAPRPKPENKIKTKVNIETPQRPPPARSSPREDGTPRVPRLDSKTPEDRTRRGAAGHPGGPGPTRAQSDVRRLLPLHAQVLPLRPRPRAALRGPPGVHDDRCSRTLADTHSAPPGSHRRAKLRVTAEEPSEFKGREDSLDQHQATSPERDFLGRESRVSRQNHFRPAAETSYPGRGPFSAPVCPTPRGGRRREPLTGLCPTSVGSRGSTAGRDDLPGTPPCPRVPGSPPVPSRRRASHSGLRTHPDASADPHPAATAPALPGPGRPAPGHRRSRALRSVRMLRRGPAAAHGDAAGARRAGPGGSRTCGAGSSARSERGRHAAAPPGFSRAAPRRLGGSGRRAQTRDAASEAAGRGHSALLRRRKTTNYCNMAAAPPPPPPPPRCTTGRGRPEGASGARPSEAAAPPRPL